MIVTILPQHTEGLTFDTRKNGVIARASKNLIEDAEIVEEYDGFCKDSAGNFYDFSTETPKGYNRDVFGQLKSGTLKKLCLRLERNNIR